MSTYHALLHAWAWYVTGISTGDVARSQESALIAIASVAAVVWTGGLIAWQLKQFSMARNVALDLVQNAFMWAIAALFLRPLSLRYLATVMLCIYIVGAAITLYQNRDFKRVKERALDKARQKLGPAVDLITDEAWQNIVRNTRRQVWISVAMLSAYVCIIVWPYETVVAAATTIFLFLGYQLVVANLNMAPDRPAVDLATLQNRVTVLQQLTLITQLLQRIAQK